MAFFFLLGNWVSKARFINQKNLKKFQLSSLSYKPKYTIFFFKKSRNTTIRLKEKESDQMRETNYPEHIRKESREKKKKNQKQKERRTQNRRTWIGQPGSRMARAAWPCATQARLQAWVARTMHGLAWVAHGALSQAWVARGLAVCDPGQAARSRFIGQNRVFKTRNASK